MVNSQAYCSFNYTTSKRFPFVTALIIRLVSDFKDLMKKNIYRNFVLFKYLF